MDVAPDLQMFDDQKKRFSDFAQKDYEMKVQYLTSHFQRMWTRFNFFVVIQAALIGGRTIFGNEAISIAGLCFGFGLSLVWYVMGVEDRSLVVKYRTQVEKAADVLRELWPPTLPKYRFVGDTAGDEGSAEPSWYDRVTGWRWEPISTTRLASLIPLAVSLVWLALLIDALLRR
jgi:hypothetical protein